MDRPTGQVIRRYEWEGPGQMVHMDVKKLGRIPEGGGHRALGRAGHRQGYKRGQGYDFIHSVVDDHSRFAYSEILPDERVATCAGFLNRAAQALAGHGIRIERVMTDNAFAYRYGYELHAVVAELGAKQVFTPFYRPQVNGKAERYNRTLLEEWAYVQPYASNAERAALLPEWLHMYNWHRAHTALKGLPPISRVNNVSGNYT
jgi:transposase InsO family protein